MSIFDRRVLIALLNRGKMAASPLRVSACVLAAITVCLLVAQASAAAAEPTCAFGRVPNKCKYECLPSCNEEEDVCPAGCDNSTVVAGECDTCASGCFCSSGLVQFDFQLCVLSEQCSVYDEVDGKIPSEDKCSQYQSCGECISSDPDCQWCPFTPRETMVKGSRCRERGVNPICPVEINDPMPNITKLNDAEFDDDVQIRPQKLKLKLRAGQPEEFTLQFRPSENFPLDVYFLLDVTGSFAINFTSTVKPLATQLVEALQNISDRYEIGFGGFADKRALPYALPSDDPKTYHSRVGLTDEFGCPNTFIELSDCNPTISFRHTTNLTKLDTQQLQDILGNISIHLNVDSLEGGMDGLVQVIACDEKIGWRNPSLRMLLYMSNADFHLAGDGKVGAAFRPNPGECLLEEGQEDGVTFQEYNKDNFYDYPSVYQLRELIKGSQTNIVFAVTNTFAYLDLAEEIGPSARVIQLEGDSSNLISVIQTSYNDISQEVRLSPKTDYPGLSFSFTPGDDDCSPTDDGEGCIGVLLGDTVSLNVSVNMTTCLDGLFTAVLQSAAFGNVELEIEPLCDCPCNSETVMESPACNGTGTLVCGECNCSEGTSGDQCQCPGEDVPPCGPSEDNQCSGRERGVCECGTCHCHIQEELLRTRNFIEPYFGEHCECDHLSSCGGNITDDGQLCSGRGDCDCETNTCICTVTGEKSGKPYAGDRCECDPDICFNEEFGECVYVGSLKNFFPDAPCVPCEGCQCRPGTRKRDGTCEPIECNDVEPCARCAKESNPECAEMIASGECDVMLYFNDTEPADVVTCTYTDVEDCLHTFYISSIIFVEEDRVCPTTDDGGGSSLVWIIPVSVIAGLLALGGLILLIVLLLVWILDRVEYQRFKSDLQDANWDQQENPMYVSPQQQYTNVAYKSRKAQKTTS